MAVKGASCLADDATCPSGAGIVAAGGVVWAAQAESASSGKAERVNKCFIGPRETGEADDSAPLAQFSRGDGSYADEAPSFVAMPLVLVQFTAEKSEREPTKQFRMKSWRIGHNSFQDTEIPRLF